MDNEKLRVFAMIQRVCESGIRSGKFNTGREWLAEQKLSFGATGAVFNSGQISQKKKQSFLDDLLLAGFIQASKAPHNATREKAYTVFAKYSVMFPLKDINGNVVNYYAVRVKNQQASWLNEEGVYPCYPQPNAKTLYIVPTVLDAASILEARALRSREAILALRDGDILLDHLDAIRSLEHLKEIIVIEK
jgi:hypothetical protein